jgi:hypothetical protein
LLAPPRPVEKTGTLSAFEFWKGILREARSRPEDDRDFESEVEMDRRVERLRGT